MSDKTEESPRVLIAEDEAGLADLYSVWLDVDFDVTAVGDGREALEQIDDSI